MNRIKAFKPTWIEGTDGKKVTYTKDGDGNITWSKNASADTIRMGEAMLQTTTGKAALDQMMASKTKLRIVISPEAVVVKRDDGKYSYTQGTTLPDKVAYNSGTKKYSFSAATVTIYEGTLKMTTAMKTTRVSGLTMEEAIGSVGVHESVHATSSAQIQGEYGNPNFDIEARPNQKQAAFIAEVKAKK